MSKADLHNPITKSSPVGVLQANATSLYNSAERSRKNSKIVLADKSINNTTLTERKSKMHGLKEELIEKMFYSSISGGKKAPTMPSYMPIASRQ